MQIIKRAVQDEINNMNHAPDTTHPGVGEYPKINWRNVYFRALKELERQVDIDSLPEDISLAPKEVINEVIDQIKDEKWVQDMLSDARLAWQEHRDRLDDPYMFFGVPRTHF